MTGKQKVGHNKKRELGLGIARGVEATTHCEKAMLMSYDLIYI